MAYEFGCTVAGSACSWKTRGETEEAVMEKVVEHAGKKHKVPTVTDTIASYLKSTIRPV